MTSSAIGRFLEKLGGLPASGDARADMTVVLRLLARELPPGIVGCEGFSAHVPDAAVVTPGGEAAEVLPLDGLVGRVVAAGQPIRLRDGSRDLYLGGSPALARRLEAGSWRDALLVPIPAAREVPGALAFAAAQPLAPEVIALVGDAAAAMPLVLERLDRGEGLAGRDRRRAGLPQAEEVSPALLEERRLTPADEPPPRRLADRLLASAEEPWVMRGSRLEYDLQSPLTALLVCRDSPRRGAATVGDEDLVALVGRALGARATRTLVATLPGQVLALLPRQSEESALRLAGAIRDSAGEIGGGASVSCFVSRTCSALDQAYARIGDLERLRRLYLSLDRKGEVASAWSAGVYDVLLHAGNIDRMAEWRDRLIGPLVERDGEHGGRLQATLETFLNEWCHLQRCADALYIHLNTLKYRLHRIEEILGLDLRDPEVRVSLLFACQLHRVLAALETSGTSPAAPGAATLDAA